MAGNTAPCGWRSEPPTPPRLMPAKKWRATPARSTSPTCCMSTWATAVPLALRGGLQPDTVMTIVTMVVAFYFGTQTEGKNNGK